MIDHLGLDVGDYRKSRDFYAAVLAPLGYDVKQELRAVPPDVPDRAGFGATHPVFWIAGGGPVGRLLHFAFAATNRSQVDAFYRAALGAGGRDNGAPGLRPRYTPITTPHLSSTPTDTISRPCVTPPARPPTRPKPSDRHAKEEQGETQ